MVLVPQRLGVPHDEHLRSSEQRRRAQLGERRSELLGVLVGPEDAPRSLAVGREETPAEQRERPIEEIRLLAEEEVVGPERRLLERGERIGRGGGAPPAARAPHAQNPSIACR